MARTLRPLSLGMILDETFDIYRHNFALFIGISAIPNLVLLLARLGLMGSAVRNPGTFSSLMALAGTLIASIFIGSIVAAAITFAVSDIYLDIPTSIGACFSRVGGKALRVMLVSFAVGLIIVLGFFLCVIPGIYFAGVYGIAIPAVVLENISSSQALSRSSSLTNNSVGRIIVIYFLTSIFAAIMVFVLSAGAAALGLATFHSRLSRQQFQEIITTLGAILFGPISAIALTLAYYDQRVRKEAFDIEHMMSLMGVQESLPSVPPPPPIA